MPSAQSQHIQEYRTPAVSRTHIACIRKATITEISANWNEWQNVHILRYIKYMMNKTTAIAGPIATSNFPNGRRNYILSTTNSLVIPKLVFTFKQLTITPYIWMIEKTGTKKLHKTWKKIQNWILNMELRKNCVNPFNDKHKLRNLAQGLTVIYA